MKKIYFLLLIAFCFVMVSCNDITPEPETPTEVVLEKHTVTFDSKGGTAVNSIQVESEKKATKPTDPTKEGYIFDGWYLGDEKWSFIGCEVTEDITLVARWVEILKPNITYYTVTFDSNGGSPVTSAKVESGKKVTKPLDPIKEGFTFDGWYVEEERWSFIGYVVTENVTLVAKWIDESEEVEISYTVTFYSNGGSSIESAIVKEGEKVIKPSNPTKEGYVFSGWYLLNEAWDFNDVVTDDITLVASWVLEADADDTYYTVIYDSNGGTAVARVQVQNGKRAIEPEAPTKDGYVFEGWYLIDEKWNFIADLVTENITLVAKWSIETDPNAPVLGVKGWCDTGYNVVKNSNGEYVVEKSANATLWGAATVEINNFSRLYSAFTLKFTSTNVTNFLIQMSFTGGDSTWKSTVTLHRSVLEDGEHEIYIDFTETNPVGSDWNNVAGYFIKDYNINSLKFSLDTSLENALIAEDANIVINEIKFDKIEEPVEPEYDEEVYAPSGSTLTFSNKNESKVITTPTFDTSLYTNNAGTNIKPYEIFQTGMCLQRDAVNRIWGKATNTNYIAAQIRGKVYYGTVENGEFEIYLPKMNAGGPYWLTLITEAGRIVLKNVYIGEVYLCAGQSNMEWQPHHSTGGEMDDLFSSKDCANDEIRLLHIGYNAEEEPTTEMAAKSGWKGANQTTIPNFSALAYIFGKQMYEELGCPIGLIATPVGGSNIEFWLNEVNYSKVLDSYQPYINNDEYMQPSLGYNGMLYPLIGLNVRGVVWYQGCSNAFGTQAYYDIALKIFIEQCREMFDNEQLSFTICELARYEGNPLAYSIVNERINAVAKEDEYIAIARNLDLGDWDDIHPADKHEIGGRAAYETLRLFFGKNKPEPIKVQDYKFNNDGTVTITLSNNASLVNGSNGFEVYVNGGYSYNCNVTINGNTLTVSASGEITKIRYGYTCQMTNEIKNDVSKMVTVYDENGFPLDLFIISK